MLRMPPNTCPIYECEISHLKYLDSRYAMVYLVPMSTRREVFEAVFEIAQIHGVDIDDDTLMLAMADAYVAGALRHAEMVNERIKARL